MTPAQRKDRYNALCESLGLTAGEAGILLGSRSSGRKYANGQRAVPGEALASLEHWIVRIEQAALAFRHNPANLKKATLPAGLHPAVRRRMLEMEVIQKHERGKQKTSAHSK